MSHSRDRAIWECLLARSALLRLCRIVTTTVVLAFACSSHGGTFTNLQVLWSFPPSNGTAYPYAAVIEGSDGKLYGTTFGNYGTGGDYGAVFKIDKDGNNFSVIHRFTATEGDTPSAPLIEASNGMLYGTTWLDGTNGAGSIFKLDKNGNDFAVIHSFNFATNDGANSVSALLQASDGALYGTAQYGGTAPGGGDGIVFRMDLDGNNFTILHDFTNQDGIAPQDAVIEGTNGFLFGTAYQGGISNAGTIFVMDKSGTNFAVIHNFTGGTNDGSLPYAGLITGPGGKLYGGTSAGGKFNQGVVFSLDYNGSNYMVLHHFGGANDGAEDYDPLLQGPDGALYGTTFTAASPAAGTVFQISGDGGNYEVLVRFANTNGANPVGALIAGTDGALYGTCNTAGTFNHGNVFRLSGNNVIVDFNVLNPPLRLTGTSWRISGHGISNRIYTVLSATNLTLPRSNWTILGTANADGLGDWQFDDLTNLSQRFYQTVFP